MSEAPLLALLRTSAALLEGLETREGAGAVEWLLDGVVVAVGQPSAAEFRLRRELAAAALRTADVRPSPRGAGWVRFAPAVLDGYAEDRARAWLESSWRHADGAAGENG